MQNVYKPLKPEEKRKTFIEILSQDTRKGMPEFLNWLETKTNFFEAPSELQGPGAYKGGALDSAMNIYQRLAREVLYERLSDERIKELSEHVGDENYRYAAQQCAVLEALLHDICKTNFYETYKRNVKEGNTWVQKDEFRVKDDILGYGHGEESVYILSGFLKLSQPEMLSIRYHMGPSASDREYTARAISAYKKHSNALLLHIADVKATYIDEPNGLSYSNVEKYSDEDCQEIFVNALKDVASKREGVDKLLKYIQDKTDFFTAPASTKYHENRSGGLLRHSLNVYARMQREVLSLLCDDDIKFDTVVEAAEIKEDKPSIALVGLTNEIWKANTYIESGDSFTLSDDAFGFGTGEESVQLLREYMQLSREEAFAILYGDCYFGNGTYNLSNAFRKYPLLVMLYTARLKDLCLS